VQRKILGCNSKEVTEGWRKMHNEDASSHFIMVIIAEVEMGRTCGTHDRTKMPIVIRW
jgi:hypothetical protein